MIDQGGTAGKKPDPRGTAPALVKAPAPELPKGGGAIRGIGEKFSANTFTGTGSLTVPIAVTPGRSGFHPGLSLTYDSGGGNGPFGLGWRLSVPQISRKTEKRIPEYRDAEQSDIYLLSGAEDLVPVIDPMPPPPPDVRRYRPRVEGMFARIERHDRGVDVHWESLTSANVRNVYGTSEDSRIADPADPRRVFAWLLERSEDSLGNVIVYEYAAENLANVAPAPAELHRLDGKAPITNRYLKRIRYGNTSPGDDTTCVFEVVFDYGEHDAAHPTPDAAAGAAWPARMDPFSSYRSGFEVRTYRLCRRILVFHRFAELGDDPCLVRATKLAYDERTSLTRLSSVVQEGYVRAADGSYSALAMPAVAFGYGEAEIKTTVQEIDAADLREGVDGKVHQWVDLDGEGIPGVVTDDGGALWYRRNLGAGVLEPPRRLITRPATTATARGAQQLRSLGGDGRLDLVELGPPLPGYHERIPPGDPSLTGAQAADGAWEPFQPFAARPDVDFTAPDVRFIDLNGDGLDDVLIAGDELFVWYPSLGKQGYGPPRTFPRPRDDERGPAVMFADASRMIFLADLSGDGLHDLVRVDNGSVCYWPNLGHGRFGAKVTMSGAPVFDRPDQFQPSRILFADIDGSGTTDIIYMGRAGVRFWFNQAGNGWGEARELPGVRVDSAASIAAFDVLGAGTACLVWSSPLPADDPGRLRYVDLLGSKKPHLLESIDNGLGLTTRMRYAPSTKFYLADRAAGRPWATRLSFPIHVLERVETYDSISSVRFVSEYRYRDGYFDGDEREFRGFGYVEQWDTESDPALSGKGLFADRPPPVNGELPQPPVVTETWLHTGAWLAPPLEGAPPIIVPTDLTPAESRDAFRALKGVVLRSRIRAEDGTSLAAEPYTVTEHGYEVRCVQHAVDDQVGVFFAFSRETVEQHLERNPDDPRVQHALTIEVDPYGHARRSVAVGYPRIPGASDARPEQQALLATLTEIDLADGTDHDDWYRHGVGLETRTYELTGLPAPGASRRFTWQQIKDAADAAIAIAYDDTPSAGVEKRLIERARTRYCDSDALPSPLPWGSIDRRALPYESYGLAFTPRMVATLYGGRVTDAILLEGAYTHLDDTDDLDASAWWAPSGRTNLEPPFYLPASFRDPFGNVSTVVHDAYRLLVIETRDATGNVVRATNDYRTMGPRLITDVNRNRIAVEVDGLGRVVATRIMGKEGTTEGDPDGEPTTKLEYTFYDGSQPSVVHSVARETHSDPATRWQHAYSYSDGAGHEVMKKVQAEPERGGTTPRWVGTGRAVFDNKGNPIKQYEPFFASTPGYETDEELTQKGVTPILHYDPLGRLVRSERPDGAVARVTFTPWRQEAWDENDTALDPGNLWYQTRASSADEMERRAAAAAEAHAGTPAVALLDPLGRPYLTISDNGAEGSYEVRTTFDVEGSPLLIRDPLGRTIMTHAYNLLGQGCHHFGVDAGERWVLDNVAGHPLRSWDSRGHIIRATYDELLRPVERWVVAADQTERLVGRTVYGEDHPDPEPQNLRGNTYESYDEAGLLRHDAYDFKGNPLGATRWLAEDYRAPLDWSTTPPPALQTESFTQVTAYDAMNRPTSNTTPDGSESIPGYNDAGLLDTIEVKIRGAATRTRLVGGIDYSEKGERLRMELGDGGSAGVAPTSVTEYDYDPLSFRLRAIRTTRLVDGKLLQSLRYTYDAVGNIVATEDEAQQDVFFAGNVVDGTARYEYDAVYRLTKAEGREHAGLLAELQHEASDLPYQNLPHPNDGQALRPYQEEYLYDPVGNIERVTHVAVGDTAASWTRDYTYAAATNRLETTSFSGDDAPGRYEHDASGNMTVLPHLQRLEWDSYEQLRSADRGGGGIVHFVYDGGGQRLRKVWEHGGLVEERIYLGGWEIYRRRRGGTLELERESLHVMDDERRIALVETKTIDVDEPALSPAPRIRFQVGNHLGTVAIEIDESGRLISYEEYHPFGTTAYRSVAGDTEVSERRYRYAGRERDEETGLYHMGARHYAAWLARWTSPDPAGLVDGPNAYGYVANNPIRFMDLTGLEATEPSAPPRNAVVKVFTPGVPSKTGTFIYKPRKPPQPVIPPKPAPPPKPKTPPPSAGPSSGGPPTSGGSSTAPGGRPGSQPGGQPGGQAGGRGSGTTGSGTGRGSAKELSLIEKAVREASLLAGIIAANPTYDEHGVMWGSVFGMNPGGFNSPWAAGVAAAVAVAMAVAAGQLDAQVRKLAKFLAKGAVGKVIDRAITAAATREFIRKHFELALKQMEKRLGQAASPAAKNALGYALAEARAQSLVADRVIGPYDVMQEFTAGFGPGEAGARALRDQFHAHHLVPVDVIKRFGLGDPLRAPSVILPGWEHIQKLHPTLNAQLAAATTGKQAEKILIDFYTQHYPKETHWVQAVRDWFKTKGK